MREIVTFAAGDDPWMFNFGFQVNFELVVEVRKSSNLRGNPYYSITRFKCKPPTQFNQNWKGFARWTALRSGDFHEISSFLNNFFSAKRTKQNYFCNLMEQALQDQKYQVEWKEIQ